MRRTAGNGSRCRVEGVEVEGGSLVGIGLDVQPADVGDALFSPTVIDGLHANAVDGSSLLIPVDSIAAILDIPVVGIGIGNLRD